MAGNGDESVEENAVSKILASEGVEFFLASATEKVHCNMLKGTTISLYFSANWCSPCRNFTPELMNLYNFLKNSGKKFEIVFVSSDRDESSYKENFKKMPWLAIPYDLNLYTRLAHRFNVNHIPTLIPMSLDGKYDEDDAVSLVEDYGVDAFPFTRNRKDELRAFDERRRRGCKIEELLGYDEDRRFIISRDGEKISVSKLTGKTVGLYFGAEWCPPVRKFTTQLVNCYTELVTILDKPFEIVFISTDRNSDEFKSSLSTMPWLAVPYLHKTRQDLKRIFNIKWIPTLVLIGPDGKTITTKGRDMISLYGAMAFPFAEQRIAEIEARLRNEGERFPGQVQDPKHVHELKLDMAKAYVCDACKKQGRFWAFSCFVCNYDLHPTCIEETF